MPSLNVLRSRHTESINAAKAIRDKAVREDRDLSAGELIEIEKHLEDADEIVAEMDRQEGMVRHLPNARDGHDARLATHRNLPNGVPRAILGNPGRSGPPIGSPTLRYVVPRDTDGSFAEKLFGSHRGENGGFSSAGEWMETIASGLNDNRLMAANRVGIDSEGGFLAPQQFVNGFFDAAVEKSVLVSRVQVFRMVSDTLHLNSFHGNNHTNNLFGGFEGGWESELSSLSAQSAKFRRLTFNAKKLIILQQTSNELMQDGSDFDRLLTEALAQAMAYKLDEAIISGTGAGRPLGILNASSTIEQAKVSGQTADTIWWKNVIDMMARLAPGCWNNAVWLTHPSCIGQLFRLDSHADYATGSGLVGDTIQPAFKESNGTFTLLGRPVLVTEKCEKLGDKGDLILVDPTQYGLGMRQELIIERSMHAGFSSDSTYYRAKIRVDGQPLWSSALTPRNDTTTLSWAVCLAERGE